MNSLTIQPAGYTRPKPTTWDEVMENWRSGKDFKIRNGPYCSIRDLKLLKDLLFDYLLVVYKDKEGKVHIGQIWLGH